MEAFAQSCLTRWDLPEAASLSLVNVSENTTFRVDDPASSSTWALRVHRPGYHSLNAIRSEIAWSQALRADGVVATPAVIAGRDGELVQIVAGHQPLSGHPREGGDPPKVQGTTDAWTDPRLRGDDGSPQYAGGRHLEMPSDVRHVTLFEWEPGREPAETDLAAVALMGEAAARMHQHVRSWTPPSWFERRRWDFDTSLGRRPQWGRWQDGVGMTAEIEAIFARTVALIESRLRRFGDGPDRFGLVHGDMRLANVLVHEGGLTVLDFDDCGFSWFLYDCATAVSFFEHKPEAAACIAAWLDGYRRIRPLNAAEEAEIVTFVMLRRLLLVAWLGSRSQTDLARTLGASYTQSAVPLCESYLRRMGSTA